MPSNHQAAIAAYDRVVGAKPPFAYESAKTAAATAIPTAESRRKLCFPFTKPRSTASYSTAVLGGLRRLVVVGFVAGVLLSAPAAAFACGGSAPSAENVYVECLPSGGGSKPTNHSAPTTTTPVTTVPSKTARLLAHAGHDKALLSTWAGSPAPSNLESTGTSTDPSAIGSAFDLGSGPTALLLILAGTAVVLLGGSGLRFWRRRDQV
jgi:hypothetical protein